jgi:sugar (pentulose or hexulose) kinase
MEDASEKGCGAYSLMDTEAEKIKPGCDNLMFHPYLQGEHKNNSLRASFTGIRALPHESPF